MNGADSDKQQHSLLKAAQADKDYDQSLELLDEILATTPDAIEAKITQTHLRALKGSIGLTNYRDTIAAIMTRLEQAPVPSIAAGRKILRGIQYSCTEPVRTQFIEALLASTKAAIGGTAEDALDFLVLQANIYLALGDHDNFLSTVDQLSHSKPSPKKLRPLKKIAKKYRSPGFPDFNADKVFGIGLSRTATSSLNLALRKLGYDSIHWLNPNTQTVISNQDFVLFDGFTDIPVSYQFEELYSAFPNSKFIYTSRSRDSWISSVSSHYKNARGIDSPTQLSQPNIAQRFNGTAQPVEWNLYTQHESWDAAFDHFQGRVNRFFSNQNGELSGTENHRGRRMGKTVRLFGKGNSRHAVPKC
jgi:tetratricopeptide (TPR) repeat protein